MRSIRIIANRFKKLPLRDFIALIYTSLFSVDEVFIYKIDLTSSQFDEPDHTGSRIVKGDLKDLEIYRQSHSHDYWEFNCYLFDQVSDFFVSFSGENIQHISWIYDHCAPNRFIKLNPLQLEIKYCLTLPEYRGQGIYPHVLRHIIRYGSQNQYTEIFMAVDKNNIASIRGIEKAGFHIVHRMKWIKVFGIQITSKYRDTNYSS